VYFYLDSLAGSLCFDGEARRLKSYFKLARPPQNSAVRLVHEPKIAVAKCENAVIGDFQERSCKIAVGFGALLWNESCL